MDKGKSFLDILKEYFSNLPEEEILVGDKKEINIAIDWIFTQELDREIINNAMANLLLKSNPIYKDKVRDPYKISKFTIKRYNDETEIMVMGEDGWTKAIISPECNNHNRIFTVNQEQFYNEILNVLNSRKIETISEKLNLSETEKDGLTSAFATLHDNKLTLYGIEKALKDVAQNLTKYYSYLIKLKKENVKRGFITQRTDRAALRTPKGEKAKPRISPIIPIEERIKMLEEMEPIDRIQIDEISGKEKVENSYMCYMYEKPLAQINQEQDGYLFICEPTDGDRGTRIVYKTKEEMEKMQVEEGEDKVVKLLENYLSMSKDEFQHQEGTRVLAHLDKQNYKERLQFFLKGQNGKSLTNLRQYLEYIRDLYKNKNINLPYYNKKKIAECVSEVPASDLEGVGNIFGTKEKGVKEHV